MYVGVGIPESLCVWICVNYLFVYVCVFACVYVCIMCFLIIKGLLDKNVFVDLYVYVIVYVYVRNSSCVHMYFVYVNVLDSLWSC